MRFRMQGRSIRASGWGVLTLASAAACSGADLEDVTVSNVGQALGDGLVITEVAQNTTYAGSTADKVERHTDLADEACACDDGIDGDGFVDGDDRGAAHAAAFFASLPENARG
jgi:hypothetical protein